jgi:hypothetical protein
MRYEFRRHSEPMGEELADAFEKYTQEMEKSSGDNPAYRHSKSEDDNSGGYSLSLSSIITKLSCPSLSSIET